MKFYILVIYNCITPVVFGPYKSELAREKEAQDLWKLRCDDDDVIFKLDCNKDFLDVSSFPSYLFEASRGE